MTAFTRRFRSIMELNYVNTKYVFFYSHDWEYAYLLANAVPFSRLTSQSTDHIYVQMAGLMATSLCLFMIAAAVAIVFVFRCDKRISTTDFMHLLS
nr:hypothetical protein HmN_000716200 [Hymenolepis microstoma]